jgi:hypothetical protein
MGVSIHNADAYGTEAVQHLVRRAHHKHEFDEKAYRFIHQRVVEGAPCQLIADELNAQAVPHYRGAWTKSLVRSAVYRMREKSVGGLSRLPAPEQLADHVAALHDRGLDTSQIADELREAGVVTVRKNPVSVNTIRSVLRRLGRLPTPHSRRPPGSRPLDAVLRRLWEETPSIAAVTRRANEQGIQTSHGKPWRSSGMARKLTSLGLRSSKTRGPYRSRGRVLSDRQGEQR